MSFWCSRFSSKVGVPTDEQCMVGGCVFWVTRPMPKEEAHRICYFRFWCLTRAPTALCTRFLTDSTDDSNSSKDCCVGSVTCSGSFSFGMNWVILFGWALMARLKTNPFFITFRSYLVSALNFFFMGIFLESKLSSTVIVDSSFFSSSSFFLLNAVILATSLDVKRLELIRLIIVHERFNCFFSPSLSLNYRSTS